MFNKQQQKISLPKNVTEKSSQSTASNSKVKTNLTQNTPVKIFDLGQLTDLIKIGRETEAEILLQSFLISQERTPTALFELAELLLNYDKADMAEKSYRAILKLSLPKTSDSNKPDGAKQASSHSQTTANIFNNIIKNTSESESQLSLRLGNALACIGDTQEALKYLEKAVEGSKDNKLLLRVINLLIQSNRPDDALNLYIKAVENRLADPKNHQQDQSGLRIQDIITNPTVKTLQLIRELSERKPKLSFVWQWLGDTAHHLGRWTEARDAYHSLAKLQALDIESKSRLGEALEQLYQYEEAFFIYLQVLSASSEKKILQKLVKIAQGHGDLELSSASVALLVELCSDNKKNDPGLLHTLVLAITRHLTVDLLKTIGKKQVIFVGILPDLFDAAEVNKNWSTLFVLLEGLEIAGLLDPLPDWLAVEVLWMAVQLENLIEIPAETDILSEQIDYAEEALIKLKAFGLWQKVASFDQKFPLLDTRRLKHKQVWQTKPKQPITSLSQFLAHPESHNVSPHILFDTIWYKHIEKINENLKHPLVHFFRFSRGFAEKSPNPNPYFDCDWYRIHFLKNNQVSNPLLHYLAHYQEAGVQPSEYFYNDYVRQTQGLLGSEEPLTYYLEELEYKGADFRLAGFSPNPWFDRKFYLDHNEDIRGAVEHSLDPFYHFFAHGKKEGRLAHYWDRYNQFVKHEMLYLEPFNRDSSIHEHRLQHLKGKKAEAVYFNGQTVLARQLPKRPLISILVPIYQVKPLFLKEMIESVIAQTYDNWQLCLVDDASKRYRQEIVSLLESYAAKDKRIVYTLRKLNGHICHTTNDCLALAKGEYVSLLDHDDLLTRDALYEMAVAINTNPALDIIYSDEDKVDEWGVFFGPYYKPDWSPHSLWARMYVCHLTTYRKALVDSVGGFRPGLEGSQDYDLLLRCSEKTKQIHHIPRILYHWRSHPESTAGAGGGETKDYAADAGRRAVVEALERRGLEAVTGLISEQRTAVWVKPKVIGTPLVEIIIPSRNGADILATCLKSIFNKTTYEHFRVTVVDNGSTEDSFTTLVNDWKKKQPSRFQVIRDDSPFNYARINNSAAHKTTGEYLLFLNNDTEVISDDWIESMLGYAQLEEVGAVGAKLYYPDDTIQHAGAVTGIAGIAGHVMKHAQGNGHGYFSNLEMVTNYSVVTAACLMINRKKFERAGGFEEYLQVAFNDVDFCLKVREQGFFNVYLPFVELYHYESKSRGYEDTPLKQERFEGEIIYLRQHWGKSLDNDPFYSPWLTLDDETMGYRFH